jgi:hypothetical protein
MPMTAVSSLGVYKLPVQPFLGFVATFLGATGAFPRVVRGTHSRQPAQHHSHHHVRAMSATGSLRYPDPVIFKAKENATAAIFMVSSLILWLCSYLISTACASVPQSDSVPPDPVPPSSMINTHGWLHSNILSSKHK